MTGSVRKNPRGPLHFTLAVLWIVQATTLLIGLKVTTIFLAISDQNTWVAVNDLEQIMQYNYEVRGNIFFASCVLITFKLRIDLIKMLAGNLMFPITKREGEFVPYI